MAATERRCDELQCPLELEAVIPGLDPDAELLPLTHLVQTLPAGPRGLAIFPARDLKSRPANHLPAGEAKAAEIVAATRRAFPAMRVGGGMPCGFAELNRNHPAAGIDTLAHATQATFHAADDVSVMETLEALPHVIRAGRKIAGAISYRLAPATIGLPARWCSGMPAANPRQTRVAMAERDPRQRGLFAAAFAIGYAAVATQEDIDSVALAATSGPFGLLDDDGEWSPLATALAGLAALSGRPRLETGYPSGIAAVGAETVRGPELWIANLGSEPRRVAVDSDAKFSSVWIMDAEALRQLIPRAIAPRTFGGGMLTLDSYAVCRLMRG